MNSISKKEEISHKALELFLEKGYDKTPMSDIAKALGSSKGGLFHHFSKKEELLFYIIDQLMRKNLVPILEKAENIDDAEKKLKYFLENFTKLLAKDDSTRVVMHDSKRLSPGNYKKIRSYFLRSYNLIYDAISELDSDGKLKPLDKAFVTFGIIGMCSWTFYWFDYSRKETSEKLAKTYIEIILNGILKKST